jgi:hypothetical protein
MKTTTPHNEFMAKKMQKLFVSITPSHSTYAEIRREYIARTGTDNTYEHEIVWKELVKRHTVILTLEDTNFHEAQVFAEPLRIKFPDQHVNIYDEDYGNFIGNTTWNDQIKMFWEYPVFTEEGQRIAEARIAEASHLGIAASWS